MPALSVLAIVGLAVITFLFVAKATPELGSPVFSPANTALRQHPRPTRHRELYLLLSPSRRMTLELRYRRQRVRHAGRSATQK